MQSTWNSWPQGRLITLLTPSTYSSRHTTHSTCLPMYFFQSPFFSCSFARRGLGVSKSPEFVRDTIVGSGRPEVVLERGRGRVGDCCSRGVVGDELEGEGCRDWLLEVVGTVRYVRTGSLSTTDLGARHRRCLIRDLTSRRV